MGYPACFYALLLIMAGFSQPQLNQNPTQRRGDAKGAEKNRLFCGTLHAEYNMDCSYMNFALFALNLLTLHKKGSQMTPFN